MPSFYRVRSYDTRRMSEDRCINALFIGKNKTVNNVETSDCVFYSPSLDTHFIYKDPDNSLLEERIVQGRWAEFLVSTNRQGVEEYHSPRRLDQTLENDLESRFPITIDNKILKLLIDVRIQYMMNRTCARSPQLENEIKISMADWKPIGRFAEDNEKFRCYVEPMGMRESEDYYKDWGTRALWKLSFSRLDGVITGISDGEKYFVWMSGLRAGTEVVIAAKQVDKILPHINPIGKWMLFDISDVFSSAFKGREGIRPEASSCKLSEREDPYAATLSNNDIELTVTDVRLDETCRHRVWLNDRAGGYVIKHPVLGLIADVHQMTHNNTLCDLKIRWTLPQPGYDAAWKVTEVEHERSYDRDEDLLVAAFGDLLQDPDLLAAVRARIGNSEESDALERACKYMYQAIPDAAEQLR